MKREQRLGSAGQARAASYLSGLGLYMVEVIGTPVRLIPYQHTSRKDVFAVHYGEKVSGDHRAILPGGRSVLIETKTILDRNLRYSDLRPHQPAGLSFHARMGGLSLLVWVHDTGINVMEWGIEGIKGFQPGKSIDIQQARGLDEICVRMIREASRPDRCHTCGHLKEDHYQRTINTPTDKCKECACKNFLD